MFILKSLREKGVPVSVLLPCSKEDLPCEDKHLVQEMASDILEPQIPDDLQGITPDECMVEHFGDCFEHILDLQRKYQYIVAVNGLTSHLAKYLKEREDTSTKTRLVLLNIEHDNMADKMSGIEVIQTISAMRSSDFIITVGEMMTQRLEPLVKEMLFEFGLKYKTIESRKDLSNCDEKVVSHIASLICQEIRSGGYILLLITVQAYTLYTMYIGCTYHVYHKPLLFGVPKGSESVLVPLLCTLHTTSWALSNVISIYLLASSLLC
jgi:CheY-like chemotaxis protein